MSDLGAGGDLNRFPEICFTIGLGHTMASNAKMVSPIAYALIGDLFKIAYRLKSENAENFFRDGHDLHKTKQWLSSVRDCVTRVLAVEFYASDKYSEK